MLVATSNSSGIVRAFRFTACDAQQGQDSGGVAGVAAQRGGDVAVPVGAQDADSEVAQAGHRAGGVVGPCLGGILGEGDIADVVQRLDAPWPRT
jgi:hypothetical protein